MSDDYDNAILSDPNACNFCGADIRDDFTDLNPHTDEEDFDEEAYEDHLHLEGKYCLYCLHRMAKVQED